MTEEIGIELATEVFASKKKSDALMEQFQNDLDNIILIATVDSKKLYSRVFQTFIMNDSLIEASTENLSRSGQLMTALEDIQSIFRRDFGSLFSSFRNDLIKAAKEKEEIVETVLAKIGITDDRVSLSEETFELMYKIHNQGLRKTESIMEKWRNFVYDTFFSGVMKSLPIPEFIDRFFNLNGTLKIGSSLENEVVENAMIAATEEKIAYVKQKAKEEGYTMCWNVNPMDPKTKPECISASVAGVIPEKLMGQVHGFPPRWVCRCDIVYTSAAWTSVNNGVNQAIEERRLQLIDDLKNEPMQKAEWKVGGVTRIPKDKLRAAGAKPYAAVESKLAAATAAPVLSYEEQLIMWEELGMLPLY